VVTIFLTSGKWLNKGAEAPLFNSTYFLFRVCVKADPATDFSAGVDLGSRNIAEALLATEGLVFSLLGFLAI